MVHKSLLLFITVFCCLSARSQFTKGTRMVGATIGSSVFSGGTTDVSGPNQISSSADTKNFSLQITPSIGWFVSNETVVGGSFLLSVSDQLTRNMATGITFKEDHYNNLDFGAGAFVRHYLKNTSSLRPFAHLYLTAGSGSTKTDGFHYYTEGTATIKDTYDGKSSGRFFYNAGLNGGFTKMLNPNVGLDLFAGYLYSFSNRTTKTTGITDHTDPAQDTRAEYETTQKFTGHGFTIGIGFQVFLSKK